jgi:hypothetical protein
MKKDEEYECKKCFQIKPLKDFYNAKRNKNGKQHNCKTCQNEQNKEWCIQHSEKAKAMNRKQKARAYSSNPDKFKERNRQQYLKHAEKRKESRKIKYREDPSKEYTATKKWRLTHPEKQKALARRNQATRTSTVKGKLMYRMAASVRYSLKNGSKSGKKWENLVGYSVEDLKDHLKKKFKNGMNWDLFMQGKIHIDHIIPISVHNFEFPTDIDFKKCWALANLQPMWAMENIIKSNKLSNPFQPSLKL